MLLVCTSLNSAQQNQLYACFEVVRVLCCTGLLQCETPAPEDCVNFVWMSVLVLARHEELQSQVFELHDSSPASRTPQGSRASCCNRQRCCQQTPLVWYECIKILQARGEQWSMHAGLSGTEHQECQLQQCSTWRKQQAQSTQGLQCCSLGILGNVTPNQCIAL